jgi:RNA polymerase sigma-70 factor (ECF subfamily)
VSPDELDHLVGKVQGGDSAAFVEVMRAVQREMRIFLSAHASSVDMVDEVLQATFVTCYQIIGQYQRRGTFLPWLKGIARNLLLKELKERARYLLAQDDVLEEALVRQGIDSAQETDLEREELAGRLRKCLDQLEKVARELIAKRYGEGMAIGRLALLFKRTESWVAVTLFRIRQTLRTCLSRSEPAP